MLRLTGLKSSFIARGMIILMVMMLRTPCRPQARRAHLLRLLARLLVELRRLLVRRLVRARLRLLSRLVQLQPLVLRLCRCWG